MTTLGQVISLHHAQIASSVALIAGFIASHVTAFLTHEHAPEKVKAPIAAITAALAGVIASIGWAPDQPWWAWVQAIGLALLSSQATYLLKAVTGVNLTQKVGLSIGAGKLDQDDGGYGVLGLIMVLGGGVLAFIGLLDIIYAAARHHPHVSVLGIILLIVGAVLVVVGERNERANPR